MRRGPGILGRVCLGLMLVLPMLAGSTYTMRVAEDLISVPARALPEFKTDPWAEGSQGNQISGVVRVMHQDARGWYWFGTQDGLARYDGNELAYFDLRTARGQEVVIRAIAEDGSGNLWFGSSGGLTRYDGEFFVTWTASDGLVHEDVWALHVDHEETVWIGTLYGAAQFDGEEFVSVPLPAGTTNPNRGVSGEAMIRWIAEDRDENLWIVGEHLVFRSRGSAFEEMSVVDGDEVVYVTLLLEDSDGDVWFGTAGHGLLRFDGEGFTNFTGESGLARGEVNALFEDSRGAIWFTIEGHGVHRYDDRGLTSFTSENGFDSQAPFFITEDADDRLWFVGFGGAYRFDGGSAVNVTRDGPW